ncbi:ATP-binding cassette domain-containing protein [Roseitalea porphyridii]|uniref:ATP-binding cassette domain-containing protein n=1 Tax=Roseitalea porphyridii TaxID=1852022 RepID=A0A4P6UXV5_9HYPH|nr:ATP-binding cassette domain-containing protein [Roseitalea porphyridii]QBK29625.1 ATP-binding cassette domain-containing protein [Roseitalea porphyridii]
MPDTHTEQAAGLRLDGIAISLDGRTLVEADHTIGPGEVLTVMGPSGSGKSTLLAFIGGFLDPAFAACGRVICEGVDITDAPPQERHAGLLFQDPLLFPHMSVGGNLVFAVPQTVRGRAARRAVAEAALGDVELEGFFDRDPDTLSGGQKARVALARVLVSEPRFMLLDEPFSKLDAGLRDQVRRLVFERAGVRRLPVLLVTHDEADAKAAGGALIEVEPAPGPGNGS